jgi:hypothetical protein
LGHCPNVVMCVVRSAVAIRAERIGAFAKVRDEPATKPREDPAALNCEAISNVKRP